MNNNTLNAAEQAMNEKEKIAMRLYFQYETPRTDYEDIVLDGYYEKIYDMIAANSTKYAIERLKETLLMC